MVAGGEKKKKRVRESIGGVSKRVKYTEREVSC